MGAGADGGPSIASASLLTVIEGATSAIAIFDREMRYLFHNGAWGEEWGTGDRDLRGLLHYEVFPDVPRRWREVHARCQAGAHERNDDDTFIRSEGSREWLRWEAGPWRDTAGEIGGIFVRTERTTEHRAIDEELRRTHQRLQEASRLARVGYWDWDLGTDRVTWSAEVYELFGLDPSRAPLSYQDYFQAIHHDDRERIADEVERVIAHGSSFYFEHRIVRPDGDERTVAIDGRVQPSVESSGESAASAMLMGAVQDVTERQALEDQLRHSQKLEATGRLAGGVAHDLNNILTVIFSFGQLVKEDVRDAGTREDIDEILRAAEQASALTSQLLAFSRRRTVMPRVLDVTDVVERAQAFIQRALGEDVRYAAHLADGLWNACIDPNALEQVILNLAVNARDAMPDGGNLTLTTANVALGEDEVGAKGGVIPPGEYVSIVLADDGVGMEEAVRAQIFEPFYTTKGLGRGTGLGLSTCYGIVRQADGYIWVYSEPGRGTTFKIYLPRVLAPTDRVAPRPEPEAARGTEAVLIAEDNAQVRRITRRVLERLGYDVRVAVSGEDALRLLDESDWSPNLLLTDVVMPGISGMVLAERVTERFPEVRVLFMSGYSENTIVHHGVVVEGVELIEKPFEPGSLSYKVREVLDHARPWDESARSPD